MNTTFFLVCFLASALWLWLRSEKTKGMNAEAFFWTNCCEPFIVISRHPFDDGVEKEAAQIRANLKAHGNPYLRDNDVIVYVYGATPQFTTPDFGRWMDLVLLDANKTREQWKAQKMAYTAQAGSIFARQQPAPSAN